VLVCFLLLFLFSIDLVRRFFFLHWNKYGFRRAESNRCSTVYDYWKPKFFDWSIISNENYISNKKNSSDITFSDVCKLIKYFQLKNILYFQTLSLFYLIFISLFCVISTYSWLCQYYYLNYEFAWAFISFIYDGLWLLMVYLYHSRGLLFVCKWRIRSFL
jgi:hypothetical protein